MGGINCSFGVVRGHDVLRLIGRVRNVRPEEVTTGGYKLSS
jgi:hypothetical protein